MKIVIFDMDGTLIDSKKDITLSINFIRKEHHNLAPLSEAFVVKAINMAVRDLPKMFYETDTYEEKDRLVFEEHYALQCVQNPYLYDGIKELLLKLLENNVKLGVATNAPTKFAKKMLQSLDVMDCFEIIIGADQVKSSKPNPEMLHKVLDYYQYDSACDEAWMIGDNSKDIEGAKNAGIDSMFALWGFSPESDEDNSLQHPHEVLKRVL